MLIRFIKNEGFENMRIINKKIAVGVLGGVLSIIPIQKAMAPKAANAATKNLQPTTVTKATENLKGIAGDTFDASKKLVKKTSKGQNAVATVAETKAAVVKFGFGDFDKVLAASNAKLIAATKDSKIFEIPIGMAYKLKSGAVMTTITRNANEITSIKIAVPKIDNVGLKDCPVARTMIPSSSETPSGSVISETKRIILLQGDAEPIVAKFEKSTLVDGKSYCENYYSEATNSGIGVLKSMKNDGSVRSKFVMSHEGEKFNSATFEKYKKEMIGNFVELLSKIDKN